MDKPVDNRGHVRITTVILWINRKPSIYCAMPLAPRPGTGVEIHSRRKRAPPPGATSETRRQLGNWLLTRVSGPGGRPPRPGVSRETGRPGAVAEQGPLHPICGGGLRLCGMGSAARAARRARAPASGAAAFGVLARPALARPNAQSAWRRVWPGVRGRDGCGCGERLRRCCEYHGIAAQR